MPRAALALSLLLALAALPAGPSHAREALRVGTSGDYAPFSIAGDGAATAYTGFDVAVARAWAQERGWEVAFVRFRWPELLKSLAEGRFDVAMSGVTVRPERSAAGRFSVPVVESGAAVLVREAGRWPDLDALDRRAARIGVNAGGHLERVASARFARATLLVIPGNDAVLRALREGAVDAAVTDTLEAPAWMAQLDGLTLLGPFTRDRKAYLVDPALRELASDLDDWLLAREADGSLARLRREHLGAAGDGGPGATPLSALLAAVDERLALMPLVGAAKRRSGVPLEAPEREQIVLDAAVASALEAAQRAGAPPPATLAVRALFRAQMEAAKEVQWSAIRDPGFEPPDPLPDLDGALRPALLRVGDRIARLLVALPAGLSADEVRRETLDALRTPRLSPASARAIADAIAALSPPGDQRSERASAPASQAASSGSTSEAP